MLIQLSCLFCPVWIIYEQVMIAALDCSRDDLAMASSYLSSHTLLNLESPTLQNLLTNVALEKHFFKTEDATNWLKHSSVNLVAMIPHLLLSSDKELIFLSSLYKSRHSGRSGYHIVVSSNVLRCNHGQSK